MKSSAYFSESPKATTFVYRFVCTTILPPQQRVRIEDHCIDAPITTRLRDPDLGISLPELLFQEFAYQVFKVLPRHCGKVGIGCALTSGMSSSHKDLS